MVASFYLSFRKQAGFLVVVPGVGDGVGLGVGLGVSSSEQERMKTVVMAAMPSRASIEKRFFFMVLLVSFHYYMVHKISERSGLIGHW